MTIRPLSKKSFFLPLAALCLMAAACETDTSERETTADSTQVGPVITVTPVNRGTHGMAERVRWAFSLDKRAILVVADPSGVENEPVPNGFFFGDELRAFQTQMDSVWDVAPSPSWKWLGFGRAYAVVDGSGTGSELLNDVSRRTSIDTTTLRAGSFAGSGMSLSRVIAQAGVIHVPDNPRDLHAADSAAPRLFPVARGWRVRWTTDGATLAVGNNPARALDDEPSQTWASVDPLTGALHGTLPSNVTLAETKFTEGPTLDQSAPIDMDKSPPIQIRRGSQRFEIETVRGVITIVETTPGKRLKPAPRVIGAGVALTATIGGRYVVALANRAKAAPGETAIEPVVYTVIW